MRYDITQVISLHEIGEDDMERINAWKTYEKNDLEALEALSKRYRAFLDAGKTERECVREAVRLAKAQGFEDMRLAASAAPGDKLYLNWMGKALMLFIVGEKPLTEGANIVGAHIDTPRMDVKHNPLYEEHGLAYLDTHY